MATVYPTDLSQSQKRIIREAIPELFRRKLKYDLYRIIEAILYIVKTGCQWNMLPADFPKWRCVYNHFRSWSDRGWFERLMRILVKRRRAGMGRVCAPSVAVIDSQSVKWGTIDSTKGIDGYKKVKGVKRNIAVDSQGYPLEVYLATANVSDSKSAYPLIANILANNPDVRIIKADKGYRGEIETLLPMCSSARLECVKSNFGTSNFIPAHGRWVVERTFSWLESYRRMTRNYEKKLLVSRHMTIVAFVAMMLRFF